MGRITRRWNKQSDWIPLSNAYAQVAFWEGDLAQARQYVAFVKSFEHYTITGRKWTLKIAEKDVKLSIRKLKEAKEKLSRTEKRVKAHYA